MPSTALSRIAWFSSSALRSDSSARFWLVLSSMIQIVPRDGSSGLTTNAITCTHIAVPSLRTISTSVWNGRPTDSSGKAALPNSSYTSSLG